MRFVKIGYNYFNPQQIDFIKPDVYTAGNKYCAFVEVWTSGKPHTVLAADLDIDLPVCTEQLEALGMADAMVAKVVDMVNEALN